jgi:predicted AAA+ superfamily ATPase
MDKKYYIQVSLSIEDEDVRRREVKSFYGIDDGYKKIIITKTNSFHINDTKASLICWVNTPPLGAR